MILHGLRFIDSTILPRGLPTDPPTAQTFRAREASQIVPTERDTAEKWRQHRSFVDPLTVVVALALAVVQFASALAVGPLAGPSSEWSLGFGVALLAVAASYATRYWAPPLYLLGALLVGTFTVFVALRDPVAVVAIGRVALAAVLFGLFVYLFYRDRAYFGMIGKGPRGDGRSSE